MPIRPFFERRHYEAIADIIQSLVYTAGLTTCQQDHVARAFTQALARTNPHFKPDRFRTACGPLGHEER